MSIHPLIIPMKQFTIISCFCALVHIKNKKELYAGRISSLLCIYPIPFVFPLSFCFD